MRNYFFLILVLIGCFAQAQMLTQDSLEDYEYDKFKASKLIVPAVTMGYGLLALNSKGLIKLNEDIHDSLVGDREVQADDFLIYVPAISVFAIDLFTHDARHSFGDRTFILVSAAAINNGATFALKSITNEKRPGEDKYNSFPSGHTSNAFMGAEFLRHEFHGKSPWYAITGYAMAFTTAYFRLYNNKHWFSDVVAGAGLGILSTNVAYWIYPWFKEKIFKSKGSAGLQGMFMPYYDGDRASVGMVLSF